MVRNPPANAGDERHRLYPWVRKIPCRREWLPTPVFSGFPGGSDGKESTCNVGDLGVCGTRGSLRTMHGGGSAPSCCAFSHRALRRLRGLQQIRVAAREASAVLCFPSRRGLTPRGYSEPRSASSREGWCSQSRDLHSDSLKRKGFLFLCSQFVDGSVRLRRG